MATPARHLCRRFLHLNRKALLRSTGQQLIPHRAPRSVPFHPFSTAQVWRVQDPPKGGIGQTGRDNKAEKDAGQEDDEALVLPKPSEYLVPQTPITVSDLDPEERADYDLLSEADQADYLALQNHYAALFETAPAGEALDPLVDMVDRTVNAEVEPIDFPDVNLLPRQVGFWADDEEDEMGVVEDGDEEDDESHITSVAHSELEVHREVREYTRVIAWDMPLLQQYAKPFQVPTEKTPLRFRYTTYMGEVHPAAKKVVLQFCVQDLPNLTEAQRVKLIKLVGPRYNPDTDEVKISCEKFEAPAQNKRYLGDLVQKLLQEARNGPDMFEDVPPDFRHHKPRRRPTFPEEWKLKPARVQELLSARRTQQLLAPADDAAPEDREAVHEYVRGLSGGAPRVQRPL